MASGETFAVQFVIVAFNCLMHERDLVKIIMIPKAAQDCNNNLDCCDVTFVACLLGNT